MLKLRPIVKWAGGKRQVLKQLKKYLPPTYNTYYEPFIGGGALCFELVPSKAVLNDLNEELINTYLCVKNEKDFEKLLKELSTHAQNNSKKYFNEIRSLDRDKIKFNRLASYKRAARLLYLNKTCFNGLFRVNSKNEFNVPYNGNHLAKIYDSDNLHLLHAYFNFNNIQITSIDFELAVSNAKQGDFVYFDPPYDSDGEIFTSYTKNGFNKDEQIRLAKVFKELTLKGVYCMLSNHNTDLILDLYKDYNIHTISVNRSISSKASTRGRVQEVLITNYSIGDSNE